MQKPVSKAAFGVVYKKKSKLDKVFYALKVINVDNKSDIWFCFERSKVIRENSSSWKYNVGEKILYYLSWFEIRMKKTKIIKAE